MRAAPILLLLRQYSPLVRLGHGLKYYIPLLRPMGIPMIKMALAVIEHLIN